ncbi:MAG: AAA family ATPase [Polyangiales bacterium]
MVLSLEGRVPAPPSVFVGREQDRRRLAVLLNRHRSVTVCGPGGLGKTSLALTVLHHAFSSWLERVRWVAARSNTGLVRAMCAALGVEERNMSVSSLFLLAESQRLVIVIDDAHELDADERDALYSVVERYAIESRWLLLSRVAPAPGPDRVLLSLQSLSSDELDELAHEINPALDSEDRARLSRAAAGSPLRLRLLLSGAIADEVQAPPLARGEGLSLLCALQWLSHPVSRSLLDALVGDADAQLSRIDARALLERTARGVRLHDEARALLGAPPPLDDALRDRLSDELLRSDQPALWLEAMRLLLATQAQPRALDAVDRRGAALLDAGLARSLATLLEPVDHRRARRWLLRALTQYPSPALLELIVEPEPSDVEARRDFATALFRIGRMNDAARVCDESLAFASAERRFDLALMSATTVAVQGDLLRALALAERLEPVLDRQRFAVDSYLCRGYALAARPDLASQIVDRWCEAPEIPQVDRAIALQLVYAAGLLGRVRDARTLLARIDAGQSYDRWSTLLAWLQLELESGRLDRVQALHEQLALEWAANGYLAPILEFVAIATAIDRGLWEGTVERLNTLSQTLAASEDRQTLALVDALADELATCGIAGIPRIDRPAINSGAVFNRWRRERLRDQRELDPPFVTASVDRRDLRTMVLAHSCEAQLAALEGDLLSAARSVDEARAIAQRAGLVRSFFAIERNGAVLAACMRDDARLSRHRETFVELAAEMPSRRAGAWARFCELCAAPEPPPPSHWMALHDADAELAVLVLALLGAKHNADRWQLAAIEGICARWPEHQYIVQPAVERLGREAWTLDAHRATLRVGEEAELDLSRSEQTASMIELLARERAATKRVLAERVWGVRDYHRLRDDKRIEVAVRKLRLKIERDPSRPRRWLTDRDGYTLGDEAPLVALVRRERATTGG